LGVVGRCLRRDLGQFAIAPPQAFGIVAPKPGRGLLREEDAKAVVEDRPSAVLVDGQEVLRGLVGGVGRDAAD
jgi:hypothetical protein